MTDATASGAVSAAALLAAEHWVHLAGSLPLLLLLGVLVEEPELTVRGEGHLQDTIDRFTPAVVPRRRLSPWHVKCAAESQFSALMFAGHRSSPDAQRQ